MLVSSTLLLAACEVPFLSDEEAKIEARREAEGKAIGSACRHAGRPIEECYERSPKTSKAAIFAGWRDMDGYMRENNIQIVSPDVPEPPAKQGETAEEKPKAAAAPPAEEKPKTAGAPPADEKPKAAEATPRKKTAATPQEAPVRQSVSTPPRSKPFNRVV
ncbi:MAG: hypothetical protein Q7U97_08870 [Rhodocyclaceae bacterium]|nr:hypothetical protein [Rhodocyclaceae bacterium]